MPLKPRTWWEVNAPSEEFASRLAAPLVEFLKRAYDNEALPKTGRPGLFFFLGALMLPDDMMLFQNEFYDDWDDRYLKLYGSSCFLLSDDEGLLYDQETLKAAFVADNNDTTGVCFHEWTWMPLEDILGAYLQMTDEGKVEAVPSCRWKNWGNQPNQLPLIEPWAIHAYTATDMEKTLSAFKRLVEAIDSRIPGKDESTYTHLPWHDPVTLAQDFIPLSSFAHEFLSAVSYLKVRFRYMAPDIRFPTVSEFLDQVITDFTDSPYTYMGEFPGDCPLRIFIIDAEELVRNKDYPSHPMPAGLYIDRVVVGHPQYWSNECELLLPFGIGANGWVRQSNGQPFGVFINDQDLNQKPGDSNTLLYQSGCPDGFTFRYHVQIHKVLENWVERVERGDWEVKLPETGGDTIWGSACEIYDKISPAYRSFLKGLTATFCQLRLPLSAAAKGFELYAEPRSSPNNVGTSLRAVHPVVRTNPVTGWKSLFAVGNQVERINDLTPDESRRLHDWFLQMIVEEHDTQLRHRWENKYDIAIWDKRTVYHSAIFDYAGLGARTGHCAVSIGEQPYFDPNSKTRREALAEERVLF